MRPNAEKLDTPTLAWTNEFFTLHLVDISLGGQRETGKPILSNNQS